MKNKNRFKNIDERKSTTHNLNGNFKIVIFDKTQIIERIRIQIIKIIYDCYRGIGGFIDDTAVQRTSVKNKDESI